MARNDIPETTETVPRRTRFGRPLLIGATVATIALGSAAALAQQGFFRTPLRGAQQGPVTVDLYDVDPSSEGATPIATLELESAAELTGLAETEGATWAVVQGSFERVIDLERLGGAMGAGPMARGERSDGRMGPQGAPMGRAGFGRGDVRPGGSRGLRGSPVDAPLRGLASGSQLTVTFYDGDPTDGGSVVDTLAFTVGEDDPTVLRDAIHSARSGTAWIEIDVDGQPLELPSLPGNAVQNNVQDTTEDGE